MKRILALAALLAILPASAHPQYLTSDPYHGDRLQHAPAYVVVTLTEAIEEGPTMEVIGPDGLRADNGDLNVTQGPQPTLSLTLRGGLGDGVYTVNWHVFSSVDGHTVDDSYQFAVGDFEIQARDTGPDRPDGKLVAAKLLTYAGLALALGGFALASWMRGDRLLAGRSMLAGTVLHLAGALLTLQQAQQDTGLSMADFFSTHTGGLLSTRGLLALGAFILAAMWRVRRQQGRFLPSIAALFLLEAAWYAARLGHSALEGPLPVLGDAVHLLAAATWVGGLLMLGLTLRKATSWDQAKEVGLRFATVALACVALVLASGVFVTLRLVGTAAFDPVFLAGALWGKALYSKMGLMLAMLGMAAFNRFLFLGDPDSPGVRGRLARFVGRMASPGVAGTRRARFAGLALAETTVGVAALVLAAILTSVSPPQLDAEPKSFTHATDYLEAKVILSPAPRAPGASTVKVLLWELIPQEDGTIGKLPVPADTCGNSCRVLIAVQRPNSTAVATQAIAEGEYWIMERSVLWSEPGDYEVRIRVETSYVPRTTVLVPVEVRAA